MQMMEAVPEEGEPVRHKSARAVVSGLRVLILTASIGALCVLADPVTYRACAAGKTAAVTMTDKPPAYVPAKLTVKVGTTVTWKNTGNALHDVTTDASKTQNKSDVALPAGAQPFDSGFMPPGTSWSYTFAVPGKYRYACIPHEKDRMIGEITVTK